MNIKSAVEKKRVVSLTVSPLELEIICIALKEYLGGYDGELMWESNMGTAKATQINEMVAVMESQIAEHNTAWRNGCLT